MSGELRNAECGARSAECEGPVFVFARALWGRRAERRPVDFRELRSFRRMLYCAVWREMEDVPGYDPEEDALVRWGRAVLLAAGVDGAVVWLGDVDTEAAVELLLKVGEFGDEREEIRDKR